jgi:HlyD family secretion protein
MNADIEVQIARRENVVVIPNSAIVNTRDATAAGAVLGISEEDMRAAMRPPARAGVAGAGETPGEGATPECTALMQKMRDGGMQGLSEEDRTRLRACGGGQGGQQLAQGGRQGGGQGGRSGRGGIGGPRGGGSQPGQQRTGMVFVADSAGYAARLVTLGVNDWEYTEVLRGVEEGEQVVIISVARLQQSQQEFLDRMRERAGGNGPIPGGGATSTRGRGR